MLSQSIHNLIGSVSLCRGRLDTSLSEPLVRRKSLEQGDGLLDVIGGFSAGLIVGVAAWLEGADACAVLVELVLPERLVIAVLADPVLIHVGHGLFAEELGYEVLDVGVLAGLIAELRICAVAVVGPETVNGPGV